MEFKTGDLVKFFEDKYSSIPQYGKVVRVNKNTCTVLVSGVKQTVKKSELNFD